MMKIEKTEFAGSNGVAMTTGVAKLIAVSDFGPRIAFLSSRDGNNILLWAPGKYTRGEWDLRGGHRVWATTPGADESEDTYRPDNQPCEVVIEDNGFTMLGAEDPVNHTRRGFTVRSLSETRFEVDNFIANTGEMLYSAGVWALTCSLPTAGCRYAVPVGDDSTWDNFSMVFFREWAGHGAGQYQDEQIQVTADQVLLLPEGRENKRMIQAHQGIIAMSDPENDLTFGKKVEYQAAGRYPLGTNIAFYVGPDNFMVEMETMGPEETIKPGAVLHHRETWVLKPGAAGLENAAASEALFKS